MSWGVSPDLFSFLTGFAGFLGFTGKSRCQQTEFLDNRAPGQARDRATEGWPEGRIETFGEGRDRLPQGSSEGGAGREILRIN